MTLKGYTAYRLKKLDSEGENYDIMDYTRIVEIRDFIRRWFPDVEFNVPSGGRDTTIEFREPLPVIAFIALNTVLFIHKGSQLYDTLPPKAPIFQQFSISQIWFMLSRIKTRLYGTLHEMEEYKGPHSRYEMIHDAFDRQIARHKEILQRIKSANYTDSLIRTAEMLKNHPFSGRPGFQKSMPFVDHVQLMDPIDMTPTPAVQQMIDLMEESKRKASEVTGIPGLSGESFNVPLQAADFGAITTPYEVTTPPVETEEGFEYGIKPVDFAIAGKKTDDSAKHMIRRELRERHRQESLHHVMTAYAAMLELPRTVKVIELVKLIDENRPAFMSWFDAKYPRQKPKGKTKGGKS